MSATADVSCQTTGPVYFLQPHPPQPKPGFLQFPKTTINSLRDNFSSAFKNLREGIGNLDNILKVVASALRLVGNFFERTSDFDNISDKFSATSNSLSTFKAAYNVCDVVSDCFESDEDCVEKVASLVKHSLLFIAHGSSAALDWSKTVYDKAGYQLGLTITAAFGAVSMISMIEHIYAFADAPDSSKSTCFDTAQKVADLVVDVLDLACTPGKFLRESHFAVAITFDALGLLDSIANLVRDVLFKD